MTEDLIYTFKELINKNDFVGFQAYVEFAQTEYTNVPWEYILEKVYIHACLKKRKEIVAYVLERFKELDPIQQIALRQMFAYGRYLLAH